MCCMQDKDLNSAQIDNAIGFAGFTGALVTGFWANVTNYDWKKTNAITIGVDGLAYLATLYWCKILSDRTKNSDNTDVQKAHFSAEESIKSLTDKENLIAWAIAFGIGAVSGELTNLAGKGCKKAYCWLTQSKEATIQNLEN